MLGSTDHHLKGRLSRFAGIRNTRSRLTIRLEGSIATMQDASRVLIREVEKRRRSAIAVLDISDDRVWGERTSR